VTAGNAIAIIPARGGSKGIPRKNLVPLAGSPLIAHTIRHGLEASEITEVIVSTEDAEIAAVAEGAGATVVARPPELATDEASSEPALIHALDTRRAADAEDPELVVFLQATSPVRRRDDVDSAVRALRDAGADSLVSVTASKHFEWAVDDGGARPLNYEPARRPRRQEIPPRFQENGSIYITATPVLRETETRLGGRIALYEMDRWTAVELDDREDLELLEWIMRRPEYATSSRWPDRLELIVFDFDGVMTDNRVLVSDGAREAVICHRGDGWGVARLRDAGVRMLVLSTERHSVVAERCAKLELPCLHALEDKAGALREFLQAEGIQPARTTFVGNDVNDLGCMREVGLSVAVADSDPAVIAAADLVLSRPGGHGAVRELCDLVLARYPMARVSSSPAPGP
jgi:YrbI family 3-deoxy-D-manno-octulosonate 8-phosphate phosphatase